MHDAFANRERERETNRSNPGEDAPNSYVDLYGRDSFPQCAEGAYSIVSLHQTSRTLLCSDTILTVVATLTFRRMRFLKTDTPQRLNGLQISRLSADLIANRIVRFKLDSLDSIKAHLPESYAKNDRECARAAINNHAPDWSFLDLRASGPLIIPNSSLNGKNHFRKLDGPRTSTVRFYNLLL